MKEDSDHLRPSSRVRQMPGHRRSVGREGLASGTKSTSQPRLKDRAMAKTRQSKRSDRHKTSCRKRSTSDTDGFKGINRPDGSSKVQCGNT